MSSECVRSEFQAGVAWITIQRESKLNALNNDVLAALATAFDSAEGDDTVRVIVLTGAGDKAFVAGADINELQEVGADQVFSFARRGQALMSRIENLGKPVIAAVNGYALGAGCELALACTLRIASDQAMLGLPEVKLGLIPGYGGTQRMARLVGKGRALHMMLTGNPVSAEDALGMGLVNVVVPHGSLHETVEKLASGLQRSAPMAMAAIMDAVNRGLELPQEQGLELEAERFAAVYATDDMLEGTTAFLEKRKADFKGR